MANCLPNANEPDIASDGAFRMRRMTSEFRNAPHDAHLQFSSEIVGIRTFIEWIEYRAGTHRKAAL